MAEAVAESLREPFELWAAQLPTDAVAMYVDGTASYPVILIDVEKHRGYEDQYGQSITHELRHAVQEREGRGYDEDEAENG